MCCEYSYILIKPYPGNTHVTCHVGVSSSEMSRLQNDSSEDMSDDVADSEAYSVSHRVVFSIFWLLALATSIRYFA